MATPTTTTAAAATSSLLLTKLTSNPSIHMLNPSNVESKLVSFLHGGASNLGVVADFDRTLTSAQSCSAHGVMERVAGASEEYTMTTQANTAKFFPIEIDPKLTIEEKVRVMYIYMCNHSFFSHSPLTQSPHPHFFPFQLPFMREWYTSNHTAMVSAGITSTSITAAVQTAPIKMRPRAPQLLNLLQSSHVPLLIFSAGLADVIELILSDLVRLPPCTTTRVVSNRMAFSPTGLVTEFSEPLIHMFNKRQEAVPPAEQLVAPNQILLGDGYGDRTMCDGAAVPPITLLKVGFLNDHVAEKLEQYKGAFDVVCVGDGGMDFVVDIVRGVVEGGGGGEKALK